MPQATSVPRLAVVGCGDVWYRAYLPALTHPDGPPARVVAFCDADVRRARRAAACTRSRWPDAQSFAGLESASAGGGERIDAVVNLTPAPRHFAITDVALELGMSVYSEKPLAGTLAEGVALDEKARARNRLLLCAPGVMATPRFRWLAELLSSGRLGRPTLAVAQASTLGPASLRGYDGDARVFYSGSVGPLVDLGVYVLHAVTGLLGPACRVQAFGAVAIPTRTQVSGARRGQTIAVETPDHVLLHLDFGDAVLGQVLASFAVPGTLQPTLELHCANGSVSFARPLPPNGQVHLFSGPLDVFVPDAAPVAVQGWMPDVAPEHQLETVQQLIGHGLHHFLRCVAEIETPVLTAGHACHVLEIIEAAHESIALGRPVDLRTTFASPALPVGPPRPLRIA